MIPYFKTSIQEFYSTKNFDSKNIMKSFDYTQALNTIKEDSPCKIITDNQLSIPYYIYFGKNPDAIVYDPNSLKITSETDPYLGAPYVTFPDITKANYGSCKTYVALIYMGTQISNSAWQEFTSNTVPIYKDKALLIYEINSKL